jgi:hypothetical protein
MRTAGFGKLARAPKATIDYFDLESPAGLFDKRKSFPKDRLLWPL